MRIEELADLGAHPELVKRWARAVSELTDVQERAVRAGVLAGRANLLVVAPTSSGKTFVGEMAAAAAVLSGTRSRALFLVPFKALAEEHYRTFRERYDDLFVVEIATGDHPDVDDDVRRGRFNLAVMTYEKLRGFLVQDPLFLERVATVVVDEVQMLADAERGAGLELLLTHLLRSKNPPQLIALSASLDDRNELPRWLRAVPIVSEQRPVPLREGVCALSGEAVFASGVVVDRAVLVEPQSDRDHLLAQLIAKALADGEQLLVFFPTVAQTVKQARRIASLLPAHGVDFEVGAELAELEQTEATRTLALTMASAVAYHNGELSFDERALVERAFRKGAVRVLISTTTLAMGVNLPCDRVIIGEAERPERVRHAWQFRRISTTEYKNAAGRAGRLGQRQAGTAILLAGDALERDALLREFALAPVEPLVSRVPGRPFGDLVFEVLAANAAHSTHELLDFVRSTFAYATFYATTDGGGDESVRTAIDTAVRTCVESGLAEQRGNDLEPTLVAAVLASSGVGLVTAARFADLARAARTSTPTPYEVLFEVCLSREMPAYPFPPDRDPRPFIATAHWMPSEMSSLGQALTASVLAEPVPHALLRLAFLDGWIHGVEQAELAHSFWGANGRRAVDAARTAAWLLESVGQAAQACGASSDFVRAVADLGRSLRYGVPPTLVPLARLEVRGIGRSDLMRILETGKAEFLDPDRLVELEAEDLADVLTASQIQRLREKLAQTMRDSLRRRKAEHLIRADAAQLPRRIVHELYEAHGGGLEQAVNDALALVGLPARRIRRQPHGEPDIVVEHDGTVVISVTASGDDVTPIKWAKAREVMSAGAGLNPINCVCVARPGFQAMAEQAARDLARESGERRLLLVTISMLAEIVLRHATGALTTNAIGAIFTRERGVVSEEMLRTAGSR